MGCVLGSLSPAQEGRFGSRLVEVGPQPGGDSVQFLNDSDGWIYGDKTFWRTSDGGKTWTSLSLPQPRSSDPANGLPPNVITVQFESQTSGWAWVDNSKDYPAIIEEQTVYRTSDGGRTWHEQPFSPLAARGTQQLLFYLDGASIGWEGGAQPTGARVLHPRLLKCKPWWDGRRAEPIVFHTTDGGKHWSEQMLPKSAGCNVELLYFSNSRQGIAVAEHTAYYTSDAGAVWHLSEFLPCCTDADWHSIFSMPPASAFFLDSMIGWLGYQDGYLFKTQDGGKSWRQLAHPGDIWSEQDGLGDFGRLYFSSARHGCILGGDRSVYETDDGGSEWSKLDSAEPIISIYCAVGSHCWALSAKRLYRIESR